MVERKLDGNFRNVSSVQIKQINILTQRRKIISVMISPPTEITGNSIHRYTNVVMSKTNCYDACLPV